MQRCAGFVPPVQVPGGWPSPTVLVQKKQFGLATDQQPGAGLERGWGVGRRTSAAEVDFSAFLAFRSARSLSCSCDTNTAAVSAHITRTYSAAAWQTDLLPRQHVRIVVDPDLLTTRKSAISRQHTTEMRLMSGLRVFFLRLRCPGLSRRRPAGSRPSPAGRPSVCSTTRCCERPVLDTETRSRHSHSAAGALQKRWKAVKKRREAEEVSPNSAVCCCGECVSMCPSGPVCGGPSPSHRTPSPPSHRRCLGHSPALPSPPGSPAALSPGPKSSATKARAQCDAIEIAAEADPPPGSRANNPSACYNWNACGGATHT